MFNEYILQHCIYSELIRLRIYRIHAYRGFSNFFFSAHYIGRLTALISIDTWAPSTAASSDAVLPFHQPARFSNYRYYNTFTRWQTLHMRIVWYLQDCVYNICLIYIDWGMQLSCTCCTLISCNLSRRLSKMIMIYSQQRCFMLPFVFFILKRTFKFIWWFSGRMAQ